MTIIKMEKMENELNELHCLTVTAFQNVTNLTPALRQLVASAKIYQKSIQTTCNLAVLFVESLQNVANAAKASVGATQKLGDVVMDIIDAFKEIENMKLELTKVFINEVIIPLESKAEVQITNTKTAHKNYSSENKAQSEKVEKAKINVIKTRRKSLRKKKFSPKYEQKEKSTSEILNSEELKLKEIREKGLRDALVEERRVYCFVSERMCAYGKGIIVYNNRISNFVSQKLPDWTQYIAKPTDLPPESEDIIKNPTSFRMGTVKRKVSKVDKKETIKRGKSFSNHYPTRYSTLDGRSSRGGSRPSIASSRPLASPHCATSECSSISIPSPPLSEKDPTDRSSSAGDSSVANNDALSTPGNLSPAPNITDFPKRCHSYSGPRVDVMALAEGRSESSHDIKHTEEEEMVDFRTKLASIQNQLNQKFTPEEQSARNRLKALYEHHAHDASQLSFEKDDIIIPICEPTSGWQYGESESSRLSGWFPAAYTEEITIPLHPDEIQPKKIPPAVAKKSFKKNSPSKSEKASELTSGEKSVTGPPFPEVFIEEEDLEETPNNNEDQQGASNNGAAAADRSMMMHNGGHSFEDSFEDDYESGFAHIPSPTTATYDDSSNGVGFVNMPPPPLPPPLNEEDEG